MDTVKIAMQSTKPPSVVVITEDDDGVRMGNIAVPADDWTDTRAKVMEHYNIAKSTRIDCTNIITALTIALSER